MAYTLSKRKKPKKISNRKSQSSKRHLKSKILNSRKPTQLSTNNQPLAIINLSNYLIKFGYWLLVIGLLILTLTFYPVILQEIKYWYGAKIGQKSPKISQIEPVDRNFGILIPKIQANAKVIANVNPFNPKEYQWQLTKGVAHAKGSSLPNRPGNVFIFAHSSDNWYNANRYNAVFYLLNKLKKDDEIIIYYRKKKYTYQVAEKKLVNPSEVSYLSNKLSHFNNIKDIKNSQNFLNSLKSSTLTLMTCWPPGTTLKRLIILANLNN